MQFNPLTRSNEDLLLRRQFLSDQKSRVNFRGYIGRGGRVGYIDRYRNEHRIFRSESLRSPRGSNNA